MHLVRALIEGGPARAADTPAQTAVTDSAGIVLAANPKRKGFVAQNTGTTVIKLCMGQAPTQTAYHVALSACTAADDGKGGSYFENAWVGIVYAISSAAGGTMVIHEFEAGGTAEAWDQNADWGRP